MASGSLQTPEVDGPTDSVGQQLPSWNCAPQCAQVSLPRGAPEIESRGGIIPGYARLGASSFRRYAAVCWAIQFPSWQRFPAVQRHVFSVDSAYPVASGIHNHMQLTGRWEQVYWMTDICQGVRLLLPKMPQVCVRT